MYEAYFSLSGAPFKLNPDPKFFFGSRSHNKAMAYLHYGVKQAEGFIVITGPVGAGKSMLIGHLVDQLNRSNVVAAHLLTANLEPEALLAHILSAFGIEPEGEGRASELEAFEDYLFDQLNRGRRVLLIMDEAQNLPRKTLEELRMLSNMDYDGTPLFQVFLIGQSEFRDTLQAPDMEQLRQRVIASYHLETLTEDETREYILHRLSVVGWREDPVFSDGAIKAIYAETNGLPRRINTLCNRIMLYCALEKRHEATGEIVGTVIDELREEKLNAGERGETEAPAEDKAARKEGVQPAQGDTEVVVPIRPAAGIAAGPAAPSEDKGGAETALSSVLDRLAAKRRAEARANDANDRQEATLKDVASAIAAATGGEAGRAEDAAAPKERTWLQSVSRSLDDTRGELKEAHLMAAELRRRREARRTRIDENFKRVDGLLKTMRGGAQ